ncbi:MAG: hypothetical protein JZU65_24845, partial [Chlorobium sp.]|nr:hypothetical protein [Chlorobium sp.]
MNTEIESEDHGVMTVREYVVKGLNDKIRCQSPFRTSSSFAAFISVGKDGRPFVYDSGTGITHWLDDKENDEFKLVAAHGVVKSVVERAKDDCGAPFEPDAIKALAVIKKHDQAGFVRIRSDLKTNKGISVVNLDKAIKEIAATDALAQTHHGYATDIIAKLTIDGYPPVGHHGSLNVVDPMSNIWVKCPFES